MVYGDRTAFPALVDGEERVPPYGRNRVYFAFTTTTNGTPLSFPANPKFQMLLDRPVATPVPRLP